MGVFKSYKQKYEKTKLKLNNYALKKEISTAKKIKKLYGKKTLTRKQQNYYNKLKHIKQIINEYKQIINENPRSKVESDKDYYKRMRNLLKESALYQHYKNRGNSHLVWDAVITFF
jgi:hypothetical protein